jgi:hypothetical protein
MNIGQFYDILSLLWIQVRFMIIGQLYGEMSILRKIILLMEYVSFTENCPFDVSGMGKYPFYSTLSIYGKQSILWKTVLLMLVVRKKVLCLEKRPFY